MDYKRKFTALKIQLLKDKVRISNLNECECKITVLSKLANSSFLTNSALLFSILEIREF